jgi:hypothetical protein
MGLKLNGTHQLLVYAEYVILLDDNTDTIKKKTQTLIDASRKVGLEVFFFFLLPPCSGARSHIEAQG